MRIYPAIDIKGGKCVRLLQGRESDVTIYANDPAKMALAFEEAGAKALHIVDLDGAFSGAGQNLGAVKAILAAVRIPVQLGGGIRTLESIDHLLNLGVGRVILGTAALNDPELVAFAAGKYPGRIVAGIDASGGRVAIKGWVELSDVSPAELARRLKPLGISTAIYTDISRDGMLSGPNLDSTLEMVQSSGMEIIASGGVSCMDDLFALESAKVSGAIVGKAIYDGRIDLRTALSRFMD